MLFGIFYGFFVLGFFGVGELVFLCVFLVEVVVGRDGGSVLGMFGWCEMEGVGVLSLVLVGKEVLWEEILVLILMDLVCVIGDG